MEGGCLTRLKSRQELTREVENWEQEKRTLHDHSVIFRDVSPKSRWNLKPLVVKPAVLFFFWYFFCNLEANKGTLIAFNWNVWKKNLSEMFTIPIAADLVIELDQSGLKWIKFTRYNYQILSLWSAGHELLTGLVFEHFPKIYSLFQELLRHRN